VLDPCTAHVHVFASPPLLVVGSPPLLPSPPLGFRGFAGAASALLASTPFPATASTLLNVTAPSLTKIAMLDSPGDVPSSALTARSEITIDSGTLVI
jgi:hypothetical protein